MNTLNANNVRKAICGIEAFEYQGIAHHSVYAARNRAISKKRSETYIVTYRRDGIVLVQGYFSSIKAIKQFIRTVAGFVY